MGGAASHTKDNNLTEVTNNDPHDYIPAWTNCSISPNDTFSTKDGNMPVNLKLMGFTWIRYEDKGNSNYSFRFRSCKKTTYYFRDDDQKNYGDKEDPLTKKCDGGDVYKKWVHDISNEHSISLKSPSPRIKFISRDTCSQTNAVNLTDSQKSANESAVFAQVSLEANGQRLEGDTLPLPLKLMGIAWICVRQNPGFTYGKYKIEFHSNVHANFSFRDADQSHTFVKDDYTDRVANGDVYYKKVWSVKNDHAIGYNSNNPKIVEVGRTICEEADTAHNVEDSEGLGLMDPQWTECNFPVNTNLQGDNVPANVRKLGIESIKVISRGSSSYRIEIKSSIKTTYHFRDSDGTQTNKNDSNTNRRGDGDVYSLWVSNVSKSHIVDFRSKNPTIKEISRGETAVWTKCSIKLGDEIHESTGKLSPEMMALGLTWIKLERTGELTYTFSFRTHIGGQYYFRDNDPDYNTTDFNTGFTEQGDVYGKSVLNTDVEHYITFTTKVESPVLVEMSYWKESNIMLAVDIINWVVLVVGIVGALCACPWGLIYEWAAGVAARVFFREALVEAAEQLAANELIEFTENQALRRSLGEIVDNVVTSQKGGALLIKEGGADSLETIAKIQAEYDSKHLFHLDQLVSRPLADQASNRIKKAGLKRLISAMHASVGEVEVEAGAVEQRATAKFADLNLEEMFRLTFNENIDRKISQILVDTATKLDNLENSIPNLVVDNQIGNNLNTVIYPRSVMSDCFNDFELVDKASMNSLMADDRIIAIPLKTDPTVILKVEQHMYVAEKAIERQLVMSNEEIYEFFPLDKNFSQKEFVENFSNLRKNLLKNIFKGSLEPEDPLRDASFLEDSFTSIEVIHE